MPQPPGVSPWLYLSMIHFSVCSRAILVFIVVTAIRTGYLIMLGTSEPFLWQFKLCINSGRIEETVRPTYGSCFPKAVETAPSIRKKSGRVIHSIKHATMHPTAAKAHRYVLNMRLQSSTATHWRGLRVFPQKYSHAKASNTMATRHTFLRHMFYAREMPVTDEMQKVQKVQTIWGPMLHNCAKTTGRWTTGMTCTCPDPWLRGKRQQWPTESPLSWSKSARDVRKPAQLVDKTLHKHIIVCPNSSVCVPPWETPCSAWTIKHRQCCALHQPAN